MSFMYLIMTEYNFDELYQRWFDHNDGVNFGGQPLTVRAFRSLIGSYMDSAYNEGLSEDEGIEGGLFTYQEFMYLSEYITKVAAA